MWKNTPVRRGRSIELRLGAAGMLSLITAVTACSSADSDRQVTKPLDPSSVHTSPPPVAYQTTSASGAGTTAGDSAKSSATPQARSLSSVPKNIADLFATMENIGVNAAAQERVAIDKLREAPAESVAQLKRVYEESPANLYLARWKVIEAMSQLALPESCDFLSAVASSPIVAPSEPADSHELGPRQQEAMIRERAVVGLSRLAQKGSTKAADSLEQILLSPATSRNLAIAAALELDLVGKLGPQHHAALKAHGLKTKFEKLDDGIYSIDKAELQVASKKAPDVEPPSLDEHQ